MRRDVAPEANDAQYKKTHRRIAVLVEKKASEESAKQAEAKAQAEEAAREEA
jgi:hypothetical protein